MTMNENFFALPLIQSTLINSSRQDRPDVRGQIICALLYALAVSVSKSNISLLLASAAPLFLLLKKIKRAPFLKVLLKVNIVNLLMVLTMILTWPSFDDGLKAGILITLRLNLICITFTYLLDSVGQEGLYTVLCSPFVPEKVRVLVILTVRGIFILAERLRTLLLAVRLRAPALKGSLKWRAFAYITASSLLQSSRRSEKMVLAIKCRGGFPGFTQAKDTIWRKRDTIFCVFSIIYTAMILLMELV